MRSFHQLVVLALPLLGVVASQEPEPASPTKQTAQPYYANANEVFQDLLNALPEESLHAALNSLGHYRDGIFESDRHGVEHVHQENPPLATKLIVAAVQDLKRKRQLQSNGTMTQNAPSTSESAKPPSSPAVVIPVPVETTTDSQGRATTLSSSILSEPTASVVVPTTRTNAQGSVEVATETKPAVIFSTTDSAGRATLVTSAVQYQPTQGQVLTQTNDQGSTFITTYTPSGGKVSSVLLLTTTGADGQPSTVTTWTEVYQGASTAPADKNPTNTAKPGLQTNAAAGARVGDVAMFGGLFGGVLAFFV